MDETGFNLNLCKKYGWSKKNTRLISKNSSKSKNYSLIGAVNKKKIIGFKMIEGGMKKENFLVFILLSS